MRGAHIIARSESLSAVRAFISNYATLYAAAAGAHDRLALSGRMPAYAVKHDGSRWLVRHYRRGGAVERFMQDRYLRAGGARSLYELRVSEAARACGIATPRVIAAAQYDDGIFARFDIIVEYIENARDLADWLFASHGNSIAIAQHAAALIRNMIAHGLLHRDLNLKNILVSKDQAWIIDLDRAVLRDHAHPMDASVMRRRFVRSLEKWQRNTSRELPVDCRSILVEAFRD